MTETVFTRDMRPLPRFLYGTAWKEDATQPLVELAIREGFRGIDTANQRRHYHEAAVGQAIAAAFCRGVSRDELFLQSKFTFRHGQDQRLPYDPKSSIPQQVGQSFASSLQHLGVSSLDSYLLHGPSQRIGLVADDWAAWESMEDLYDSGRVRSLGVSNVSLLQLEALCEGARVLPRFVQNRCYADRGWDRDVRQFCVVRGIIYQGFSLLTANRAALANPAIAEIANCHRRTIPQIVFRFAIEAGMLPLTGTTSADHMRDDLEALNFRLNRQEIDRIERLAEI